jgi:N-acetylmuramoyl-L-alanine amidase CwlA
LLAIEKYQINKNFIPNLPQKPFRNGVGQYEGCVMHSTAVNEDTATNERAYECGHHEDAFVTSFSDHTQILVVSDPNYICYGACHTANQFLISHELCQSVDTDKFLQAYDKWVWISAYYLFQRKLGVVDKVTIWSHKEISDTFRESNHQDPIEYLASHNVTWQQVVQDVTNYYNQFEEEDRVMNELLTQIQQLQQEVAQLKEYQSMPQIPAFAAEAVQAACNTIGKDGEPIMNSPEGRSYDLYAIMTILHRKGII